MGTFDRMREELGRDVGGDAGRMVDDIGHWMDRLGPSPKKESRRPEPTDAIVEQGGGRAFYDFQKAAEENFLKEVAKALKKVMGGHAEKIDVQGDRLPFMVYKGQNMSDMDAELTVSLSPMEDFQVKVMIWGDVVGHGNVARDKVMKSGVATPTLVAAMVAEILGGRLSGA